MRGLNKKGQGLSTNTVILLVLGLIVLAALAYGFYTGFEFLRGTVEQNNVDDIVTQCKTQCSLKNKYDYCAAPKTLIDAEGNKIKTSCEVFSKEISMGSYGVEECAAIDCSNTCASLKVNDVAGTIVEESVENAYDITRAVGDVPEGSFCVVPFE
jgi:hypothetical protein